MKRNVTECLFGGITALMLVLGISCQSVDYQGRTMNVLDTEVSREGFSVIKDGEFRTTMDEVVRPELSEIRKQGVLSSNSDGHRIYYEHFDVEDEKGTVVIMHGFTEFIDKYSEVIWYFISEGWDVWMPEHLGHGWSERMSENLSKVVVDEFQTYVDDAFQFVTDVVNKGRDRNEPLVLFGHSMGGGISARMLEDYPGHFDAAILSSPMLEINTGATPEWIAKFFAGSAKAFGAGENYIFGHYDYLAEDLFQDPSCPATSYERYKYFLDMREDDEWKQMYGASWYWLDTAISATREAVKEENARKVRIPVLLFQAENDTLVRSSGQLEFASHAKDVNVVYCPDTRHEIMNSPEHIVNAYWVTIFDFLDRVLH